MQTFGLYQSRYGLDRHGFKNLNNVYWNLTTPALYEEIVRRREGLIACNGPVVVRTGQHTGRSPNDKFIVREPSSEKNIWWGPVNRAIDEAKFDQLHERLLSYLQGKDLFVQDCFAGADPQYRLPVRVITEQAWASLFARNLLIQPSPDELKDHVPAFTVIDAPSFHARPESDGTRSEVFIEINFARKVVLIGGTNYAGEIKKSIFSILNYLLPLRGVLSMHCSANVGRDDPNDVALFFGLSGTGKTTLSSDPHRLLIGDDEHGWSDRGVFNFEGGCYAKVINLSAEAEPEIYEATERFGTVLENVMINVATRQIDLADASLTENTRAAYPLTDLSNIVSFGMAGQPRNIILLTADAFGVLPPISKLTYEQTMYHFLSGYTAKVAGTEKGVQEPQATFSTCFGAPFLLLHPSVYAQMLGEKIRKHDVTCWLINTGWTGGPYGTGRRIPIRYTRAMVRAALSGALREVPLLEDPYFGLYVPTACPGVPDELLHPKETWEDQAAYERQARKLAAMFVANFRQYAGEVPAEVVSANPPAGLTAPAEEVTNFTIGG